MQSTEIVILGGGLSGLLIAYFLRKEEETLSPQILEARSRLGGRICTLRNTEEPAIEMGATWLGEKHHHLLSMLGELEIPIREQYMGDRGFYEPMSVSPPQLVDLPDIEEPSYRIEGGTDRLIQVLREKLDEEHIHLEQRVHSIRQTGEKLEVQTAEKTFEADFVISTLPPKLLTAQIDFTPVLPEELVRITRQTHTWMADSIKIAFSYKEPFWRNVHSSGTIFSNVGPVNEMYDHSDNKGFALKGFMNPAYCTVPKVQRKKLVLEQLRRFYGDKADQYIAYHEMLWMKEPFTYNTYENTVVPHQNNGHELFRKPLFNQQLLMAGAETATAFPGYMDGAVESARRVVNQLKNML